MERLMRLHEFSQNPQKKRTPSATVARIQQALISHGFELPRFGVDGLYGPETRKSLIDFQKANNISPVGTITLQTVSALLGRHRAQTQSIPNSKSFANSGLTPTSGKHAAERYLGRELSNEEWELLIRATAGEATSNQNEQAHVMGVILNRVRSGRWGNTVRSVLYARNQFQAVTGTRYKPGPNAAFRNPGDSRIQSINDSAIKHLNGVPRGMLYFTAHNPKAYGKGTNINFRTSLLNKPGRRIIGGTIFA